MRLSILKQGNCSITSSDSVELPHIHYSNLFLQQSTKNPVIKFSPLSPTHQQLTSTLSVSQRNILSFVYGKQIIDITAQRSYITKTSRRHSNRGTLIEKRCGTSLIGRKVELYGNSNQIPSLRFIISILMMMEIMLSSISVLLILMKSFIRFYLDALKSSSATSALRFTSSRHPRHSRRRHCLKIRWYSGNYNYFRSPLNFQQFLHLIHCDLINSPTVHQIVVFHHYGIPLSKSIWRLYMKILAIHQRGQLNDTSDLNVLPQNRFLFLDLEQ